MSKHSNYIFTNRHDKLERAVGFAGQIEPATKELSTTPRSLVKDYYYYGTKQEMNKKGNWIFALLILPVVALSLLVYTPLLGFVFIGFVFAAVLLLSLGRYLYTMLSSK